MSTEHRRMSKQEVLEELDRLRRSGRSRSDLATVLHELTVYEEEMRIQNEELVEAQRELEESRDRYADLYDFAPVAYLTLDPMGVIEEANLTATVLLGIERKRLMGMPLLTFIPLDRRQEFLDHMVRCRNEEGPVATETAIRNRQGVSIPIELRSTPATRSNQRGKWYRTALIDLSERKRAEEQVRRLNTDLEQRVAQRTAELEAANRQKDDLLRREQQARAEAEHASRAKDQFLAVLSHELRTPLTPALAATSLLQRDPTLPGGLRDPVSTIRRNIELEARLIDDLLDLNRIAHGKMDLRLEQVDVHAAIRRALETCRRDLEAKKLVLTLKLDAQRHHVRADEVRLQQVFWNLLSNAIKFTPAAGEVRVISSDVGVDRMKIDVLDSGIGIEPRVLPHLFKLFEQGEHGIVRQFGGLGVGLAVVRAVVEAHAGTITVRSGGRGQGASFTVELPTVQPGAAEAQAVGAAPAASSPPGRPLRILLVEDHADTLQMLARLLSSAGFELSAAMDYQSALKAAEEQSFDLVISDIGLPDGNGMELMRRLREKSPVKGIAVTGFGMEEDRQRTREAGFVEHITKPVDFTAMLAAIQRVTGSGPGTPASA